MAENEEGELWKVTKKGAEEIFHSLCLNFKNIKFLLSYIDNYFWRTVSTVTVYRA